MGWQRLSGSQTNATTRLTRFALPTPGARALTKHTHRDTRGEWWPRMSGSEAAKNQLAAGALRGLLGGAVWVNLHQLPPFDSPKYVLELRTLQVSSVHITIFGVGAELQGRRTGTFTW